MTDGATNTTVRQLRVGDTFKAHRNAVTLWRLDRFADGRAYATCDREDITKDWRTADLNLDGLVWKESR